MERLLDEMRGYAIIRAVGAEPTKLLDRCAEEQIEFWGAYPEDDFTITFCTRLKNADAVLNLCGRCCCEASVLERRGFPVFIRRIKRRYALWIMPAAMVALLFACSFFIWDIEITGNETVSDTEILNALEDSGVYLGSFWPSFTSDNIRSRVLVKIPELKWVSVSVFGSKAVIEVRERTEKPEIKDEDEPVKIIAGQSGIIDKMQVLRGYALYKPGQTAVKDDVIIGGAVPSTFGKTKIIHAEGSVLARTWHEICAIMPLRYREKTYTGESHSRYALIVGRKRINFYSGSRIFSGNCDNIISKKNVGMKGLFELPVIIVREQSLEYEISYAEIPEDYAHKELEVLLQDELKQRIGSSGEIVSSEYTFCIAKGYAVGTLRAECRQDIAKEEKMSQDEINAAKSAEEEKNTE